MPVVGRLDQFGSMIVTGEFNEVGYSTIAVGQSSFITSGTFSWTVPTDVTSISVVAVGGGGGGGLSGSAGAGGGGSLAYVNSISVTPGETLTVGVGTSGIGATTATGIGSTAFDGGNSYLKRGVISLVEAGGGKRGNNITIDGNSLGGAGGTVIVGTGGSGGSGGNLSSGNGSGGGGAGGYSGSGGAGGTGVAVGSAGTGGAAGGGAGNSFPGAGGGGVEVIGEGANGPGGTGSYGGSGGSGGMSGEERPSTSRGGNGGKYGGGGATGDTGADVSGFGASGAVRIIWGPNRQFPSVGTFDFLEPTYAKSGVSGVGTFNALQFNENISYNFAESIFDSSNLYLNSIALDNRGNIYACGYANTDTYSSGMSVLKYDNSGIIQWQRRLSSPVGAGLVNIYGNGIVADSNGDVYVTGNTSNQATFPTTLWVVAKYNSAGTLLWQKNITAGQTGDIGYGIAVDSSNNVYVAGATEDNSSRLIAGLYKLNSSQTLALSKALIFFATDTIGTGIDIDSSENIHCVGYNKVSSNSQIFVTRYNSSGNIQWQNTLITSSATPCYGTSISADNSGNSYIVGYYGTNPNIIIAKYDNSGIIKWQRSLDSGGNDYGKSISADNSGNSYIVGYYGTNPNIIIAKYDTLGNLQWQRSLDSGGNDYGTSITIDTNYVYISGYYNDGIGKNRGMVAKLSTDGDLIGDYGKFSYAISNLTSATSPLISGGAGTDSNSASVTVGTLLYTSQTTTFNSVPPTNTTLSANVFAPYDPIYDEFGGVLFGPGQGTFMRHQINGNVIVYNEINEIGLDPTYVSIVE